jgi:hypothetical protein
VAVVIIPLDVSVASAVVDPDTSLLGVAHRCSRVTIYLQMI